MNVGWAPVEQVIASYIAKAGAELPHSKGGLDNQATVGETSLLWIQGLRRETRRAWMNQGN